MSPTASVPPPHTRVDLQVGERRFTTLISTLTDESSYFASLFSDRWEDSKSDDGSYFVDADPDLFVHVLRYLRRGSLPIVYDRSRGFDYAFYQALQEEASYFGIEPLLAWVKGKHYLDSVTIQYSVEEIKEEGISARGYNGTVDGNTERSYYPSWGIEKVYQCPRNIYVHDGNPNACGKACEKAKDGEGDTYVDKDILRTLIVTKKVSYSTPRLATLETPMVDIL